MSDRTTRRVGRPSLGESTASCWGLLGASLTWQPQPDDGEDRGLFDGPIGIRDNDGVCHRVIDVAEAEREAKGSSARWR